MIRAQSADGKMHEFPDGTSEDVIDRVMRDYAQGQQKSGGGIFRPVEDATRPWKQALAKTGADLRASAERGRKIPGVQRPFSVMDIPGVEGAQTVANLFGLAWSPAQGVIDAAVSRPAARGAIAAGLPVYESPNLFKPGPQKRLSGQEAEDAVAGDINLALSGARAPGKLTQGRPFAPASKPAPRQPAKAVPTLDELKASRKAAYKDVERSGHSYSADDFGKAIGDIKAKLAAEQFDPDFHPQVQLMIQRLEARAARGDPQTLGQLDDLRKFINKNVRGDANQKRLGGVMARGVDDFIDGQGGQGAEIVGKARDLYKREKKVEEVLKLQEKSKRQAARSGSGGNFDNATRQNMDKILERNPYLTADERAALESIIMGDPGQNVLRAYGKTSPLAGGLQAQANAVGGVMTGGAGIPLHTVPSSAAKLAADNITRKKVADLIDLMAVGGSREQLLAAQQQAKSIPGPAGVALQKLASARLAELGALANSTANLFREPR